MGMVQMAEAPRPAERRPASRLEARFGPRLLEAGYTVTPNLLLRYAARIGLSGGELLLVQYIWQYWRDDEGPHPSVALLARQMGRSERMVRYYLQGLRGKGLVNLEERHGRSGERLSNRFDFAPLLAAVAGLAGCDRACTALQPPPAAGCPERLQAAAGDQRPDPEETTERRGVYRSDDADTKPAGPTLPDLPADERAPGPLPGWEGTLNAIGLELGDEAHPRVSARRAANLLAGSGRGALDFLHCLLEARAATLANAPRVRKPRGEEPGRKNLMPYFFATLEGLLGGDPARPTDAFTAGPPADAREPEPGPAPADAWGRLCAILRGVLAPEVYARRLAQARQVGEDGERLVVRVPTLQHARWLEGRLGAKVAAALAEAGMPGLRVVYVPAELPADPDMPAPIR